MNRYGSIYVLTNNHTGEQYVGQTVKAVARRWYAHCIAAQKPKFPVAHSIAQYGRDAFSVVEAFVAFDKEALNCAEKTLIAELKPTLNKTAGGAGASRDRTDAERRTLSEKAKQRWANPEWRAKTVCSIKQAAQTPEAVERGKRVAAIGNAARWAGHQKKPQPLPRVKVPKEKLDPRIGRARSAQAKWKPVYCPQLQCSFLSQKAAAEFLGVLTTSVANAVKQKGKVLRTYTLEKVA